MSNRNEKLNILLNAQNQNSQTNQNLINAINRVKIMQARQLQSNQSNKQDETEETGLLPSLSKFWDKFYATTRDIDYHLTTGFLKAGEGLIDVVSQIGRIWDSEGAEKFIERDLVGELVNYISENEEKIPGIILPQNYKDSLAFYSEKNADMKEDSILEGNAVGGYVRQGSYAIGNLLPSLIVAYATGGGSLVSAPTQVNSFGTAMQALGNSALSYGSLAYGASIKGQVLEEKLKEGYDFNTASLYASASATLETLIESASGGIGGVGDNVLSKYIGKKGTDSIVSKIASNKVFNFVSNMVGEGVEEVVSTAVDPLLQKAILNVESEDPNFEDYAEAFVVGSLVSGVLQGAKSLGDTNISNNSKEQLEVLNNELTEAVTNRDVNKVKDVLHKIDIQFFAEEKNKNKQKVDNIKKNLYNVHTNENFEVNNDDNEFRRLQEESRRMLNEFSSKSSTRTHIELDENIRERYTRSIRRQLGSGKYSLSNGSRILKNTDGKEFNLKLEVDSKLFHDAFETIKPYLKQNELVDLHEDYSDSKCFLSEDGLQGFAIDKNGNLISVFNADDTKRGFVNAIAPLIIENGATHLDCYGYLANYYKKTLGFKIASIMDYNMEYDHHNIGQNYKYPKVAFMVNTSENVETKYFNKDQYDEAVAYQQSFIKNKNEIKKAHPEAIEGELIDDNLQNKNSSSQNKLVKDIPADYVKAYADVYEKKTFTKAEVKSIIDNVLKELAQGNDIRIKGGKDAIIDLLFQRINSITSNSKATMRSTISEVVDYIIEFSKVYSKENFPKLNQDEQAFLNEVLTNEFLKLYAKGGKNAKLEAFKKKFNKTVNNLYKQVKELKLINKEINEVLSITNKLKEYSKKNYLGNGDYINDQLKGLAETLSKVKRASYISKNVRKTIQAYKEKFYNTDFFQNNEYMHDYTYNPEIAEDIELILKNVDSNKSLNLEEVQALKRILKDAKKQIENFDAIRIGKKIQSAREFSKGEIEYLQDKKPRIKGKHIVNISNPRVLIEMIDSGNSEGAFKILFEELRKGETGSMKDLMWALEDFDKFANTSAGKKYLRKIQKTKYQFNSDVQMTRSQALSLYELWKRKEARTHLISEGTYEGKDGQEYKYQGEGFTIVDEKGNQTKVKPTLEDFEKLEQSITDEDKKFLALVEDFFNNKAKKLKVKGDEGYYGYTNVIKDFYFPMQTDPNSRYKNIGNSQVRSVESVFGYSFNKDIRKGANNSIMVGNIVNTVKMHAEKVSKYANLIMPIKNIDRVFNVKTEKGYLREEVSKIMPNDGIYNYINELIQDLQGVRKSSPFIYRWLTTSYAKFQLGANLKSILSQVGAIPNAIPVLGIDNIVISSKNIFSKRNTISTMNKYCTFAEHRHYDSGLIKAETNEIDKSTGLLKSISKVGDFFMKGMNFFDKVNVQILWNASQQKAKKDFGYKIGTEENLTKAGEILEEVLRRTQSNNSVLEKSAWQRSENTFIKSLTVFKSDAIQMWSNVFIGAIQAKNKTPGGKQFLTNSLVALTSGALLQTLIAMFAKWLKQKDKEEELMNSEEMLEEFILNTTGGLPIVGQVLSSYFNNYEYSTPMVEQFNNLLNSITSMTDLPNFDSSDWRNLMFNIGSIFGIPTRNITNYGLGIINKFNPETAYNLNTLLYEESLSSQLNMLSSTLKEHNNVRFATSIVKNICKTNKGVELDENINYNKFVKLVDLNNNVLPKNLNNLDTVVYNGEEIELDDKTQNLIISSYQKNYSKCVNKIINNYASYNDEIKAKAISIYSNALYTKTLEETLVNKLNDIEGISSNNYVAVAEALNIDLEDLCFHMAYFNSLSGDEKKKEVAKYIKSLKNLSSAQRYLLFGFAGYKNNSFADPGNITLYLKGKGIVKSDEINQLLDICNIKSE